MRTKIVPFDLETAKKIQEGKLEGKIVANKHEAKILTFELDNKKYPIAAVVMGNRGNEYVGNFNTEGKADDDTYHDLYIALLVDEHGFETFEKVLVRDKDTEIWHPTFFAEYTENDEYPYGTTDYHGWKQCIPFKGNESLVGKKDSPSDK